MRILCLALLLAFALPAAAADASRGRMLYQTHCLSCHYERLHERPRERSRVHSLAALRIEVAERAVLTGRPFTFEDLDDIAEYLNRSHYDFQR
jgi:mono/diheme cytochrome c family protein